MKTSILLLIFLSLSFGGLTDAYSLMIGLGTNQLVEEAELIVEGNVRHVESDWNLQQTVIMSRAYIDVEEVFKGGRCDLVEIEYMGGIVGDIEMRVSDSPQFLNGERVILFLNQQHDLGRKSEKLLLKGNAHSLVGRAQGKYTITDSGLVVKKGFTVTDDTENMVENHIHYRTFLKNLRELIDEE